MTPCYCSPSWPINSIFYFYTSVVVQNEQTDDIMFVSELGVVSGLR